MSESCVHCGKPMEIVSFADMPVSRHIETKLRQCHPICKNCGRGFTNHKPAGANSVLHCLERRPHIATTLETKWEPAIVAEDTFAESKKEGAA